MYERLEAGSWGRRRGYGVKEWGRWDAEVDVQVSLCIRAERFQSVLTNSRRSRCRLPKLECSLILPERFAWLASANGIHKW